MSWISRIHREGIFISRGRRRRETRMKEKCLDVSGAEKSYEEIKENIECVSFSPNLIVFPQTVVFSV